ncbi:MAG: metallopeptidase TldD-related protein [Phormidesmis sp.]
MILVTSDSALNTSEGKFESSLHDSSCKSYETVFSRLLEAVGNHSPHPDTHFTLSLTGETSQFTRFSRAKVRQTGQVRDGKLRLTLSTAEQTASASVPFVGEFEADWVIAQQALTTLQQELPQLPVDPYVVLPSKAEASRTREVRSGHLLAATSVAETLIAPVRDLDFSGLYAAGTAYRAYGDSADNRHWFETPSFTLDYSLFGECTGQAVKGILAGHQWDPSAYDQSIAVAQRQLALLARPLKAVARGDYRTYLAPTAVADLIDTLVWGGLGEAALRQGNSAFSRLEQGDAFLSDQFSLREDFQRTAVPRFNGNGAIAPSTLPIIQQGRWANALVSDRSAKEYGKPSNAANRRESMRAPAVAPGQMPDSEVLARLDTGLYLSNLHYLNWSDLTAGRITGMTRYACFWVERGEIVAPIENLRFDDNFYRFLGEGLMALTDHQTFAPTVDTYERRSLGGMWTPGMLIDQFRYTL